MLKSKELALVDPVFQVMNQHLAASAILAGEVPGWVYVDDPDEPRAALTWRTHRFYLAGAPNSPAFNRWLSRFFADTLYPQLRAAGAGMLVLYYAPDGWDALIGRVLESPIKASREYYEFSKPKFDWRTHLPDDIELRSVDTALLTKPLVHLDALIEEMQSERPSVDEFLDKSFGVCLVRGDALVGWCLSEYNTGKRCELGIEVLKPFRRRGLGAVMASAMVERAQSQGITRIGWHCYADNVASAATARRVGFEKRTDYSVYISWLKGT